MESPANADEPTLSKVATVSTPDLAAIHVTADAATTGPFAVSVMMIVSGLGIVGPESVPLASSTDSVTYQVPCHGVGALGPVELEHAAHVATELKRPSSHSRLRIFSSQPRDHGASSQHVFLVL